MHITSLRFVLIALASRLIKHTGDTFETKVICGLETCGLKLALLPSPRWSSACLAPQPGQAYRPPGIQLLLLQCAPGKIIKLWSPHWYQQTSLPS